MATKSEIYNGAFGLVGIEWISSLTEDSVQRRKADDQYDEAVKSTLEGYGWRFATKRVELAEDSSSPVFEYENQFVLPSDHIRTLSVYNGTSAELEWEEEGQLVLTDEDTFYIKYTSYISNESVFPPLFVAALEYKLASLMAIAVRNIRTLAVDMNTMFDHVLKKAETQDAKGRSRRTTGQSSTWLSSRTTPVQSFTNVIKVT